MRRMRTAEKERECCEALLNVKMNNEIPEEVFSRRQQEVEKRIAGLEQQMALIMRTSID